MGTINKGILGAISGKVGTVVGSSWKGKPYLRSVPARRKNRKLSDAEKAQRAKFRMAADLVNHLSSLILDSYQAVAGQSERNVALSIIMSQAIGGAYPNFMFDYGLVSVAKGSLKKPSIPNVESTLPGKLRFTWTDDSGFGNASPDDEAILVAFDEQTGELVYSIHGLRDEEQAVLDVPSFSGKPVHTWLAFRSVDGKRCSDSGYTGVVAVQ